MFDRFEFVGLTFLTASMVLLTLWGLRRAGLRYGRPVVWLLASGAFLIAVQDQIVLRPALFSVAAFPVMLGLIERARHKLEAHGNRPQWEVQFVALVPAIVLQWFWINCHHGGAVGLALLGGHACMLLLAAGASGVRFLRGVSGPRPTAATVGIGFTVAGVALAVGVLNPAGVSIYSVAFEAARDETAAQSVGQGAALTLELARDSHPVASVLVVLAVIVLTVRLISLLHSPRSLRVNAALARFYHHTGQRELMLRVLATIEEIAPDHPDVAPLRELLTR